MTTFRKLDKPPLTTENLIVVALDDFGHGYPEVDQVATTEAGFDENYAQLSKFFIGYRPADKHYYVVEKGKAFEQSQLPETSLTKSGLYYNEVAGPYVASGAPQNAQGKFTSKNNAEQPNPPFISMVASVTGIANPYSGDTPNYSVVACKKYDDPSKHQGGSYYVSPLGRSFVKELIEKWNCHYDPAPEGLTDTLLYSYVAIDNRSLKGRLGGSGGSQGPRGYQGHQASPTGYQGYQGEVGVQGYQGGLGAGYQGARGPQGNAGIGVQGGLGHQGPEGPEGSQGPEGPVSQNCVTGKSHYNLVCWSGQANITDCGTEYTSTPSVHLTPHPSDPLYSCIGTKSFAMQAFTGSCFDARAAGIDCLTSSPHNNVGVTGIVSTGDACWFTEGYDPVITVVGGGATSPVVTAGWCSSTQNHYGQWIKLDSAVALDTLFPVGSPICIEGSFSTVVGEKCGLGYVQQGLNLPISSHYSVCQGNCAGIGSQGPIGPQGNAGIGTQGYQGYQGADGSRLSRLSRKSGLPRLSCLYDNWYGHGEGTDSCSGKRVGSSWHQWGKHRMLVSK